MKHTISYTYAIVEKEGKETASRNFFRAKNLKKWIAKKIAQGFSLVETVSVDRGFAYYYSSTI